VAEHSSEFEPIGCGGHKSATSCSALYSTVAASGLPESVCFAMAASGLPESVQYSAVAYCTVQYSTVTVQCRIGGVIGVVLLRLQKASVMVAGEYTAQ
jgi:hypothetical protein